jgi:hypothetical protein
MRGSLFFMHGLRHDLRHRYNALCSFSRCDLGDDPAFEPGRNNARSFDCGDSCFVNLGNRVIIEPDPHRESDHDALSIIQIDPDSTPVVRHRKGRGDRLGHVFMYGLMYRYNAWCFGFLSHG